MYGEDIKALRAFQTPSLLLEVVNGDHLELRKISYIGRFFRWLGLGYRNTTLEKVAKYIADNINDLAIAQGNKDALKRIVKRFRRADRLKPTRFPKDLEKINQTYKSLTNLPVTRHILEMTDAEIYDNLEDFTIRELHLIPSKRVYHILAANSWFISLFNFS